MSVITPGVEHRAVPSGQRLGDLKANGRLPYRCTKEAWAFILLAAAILARPAPGPPLGLTPNIHRPGHSTRSWAARRWSVWCSS